jgi:hypothetical protein
MSCSVSRNWFLGGYHAQFSFQAELPNERVPHVIHALLQALRKVLPQSQLPTQMVNIKGRTPQSGTTSGSYLPPPDEVLTIGGTIATAPSAATDFEWMPFRFSISSRFAHFEGASKMAFTFEPTKTISLPDWLPWWLLAAAAPIQLQYCRIGLEVFTAKFSIARFGFAPVVSESLYLEIEDNTLSLSLHTQQPRWERANPLISVPQFRELVAALDPSLGIHLAEQFATELKSSGKFRR